ncbi:hypothetical protein IF1G_10779 [Cordyceps javanica]|uniref:Uncharacterized protein n=1 Tax=Cordyceps javanica TaxID=43265 RepID=A0A545UME5_9HYPO|nr:hypothetical protein IF1G_10779 [Cordyceps javanica]TQW02073.1 hypothetical protein IF2G_10473 [Cordyceps javanica]
MRFPIVAVGAAVTLGSAMAANEAAGPKQGVFYGIPPLPQSQEKGAATNHVCHDSKPHTDGRLMPCYSKMQTLEMKCPKNPKTAELREEQRKCLCDEGSSFLQDCAACDACLRHSGLQAADNKGFWTKYWGEIRENYCKVVNGTGNYEEFRAALDKRELEPSKPLSDEQIAPSPAKEPAYYYEQANVPVPKQQGGGNITIVSQETIELNFSAIYRYEKIKYPVLMVLNPKDVQDQTPPNSSISASITNSTTLTKSASAPSTFVTVTSASSTVATSLLPTTTPSPDSYKSISVEIHGKMYLAVVVYMEAGCYARSVNGELVVDVKIEGIDQGELPRRVQDKQQLEEVMNTLPDGSRNKDLCNVLQKVLDTEAPLVEAPATHKEPVPPLMQGVAESNVTSYNNWVAPTEKPTHKPVNSESKPYQKPEEKPVSSESKPHQKPEEKPVNSESKPYQKPEEKPVTSESKPHQKPEEKPVNSESKPADEEAACPAGYEPVQTQSTPNTQADIPVTGGSEYSRPPADIPATSGPKHPEPHADAPATSGSKHPEVQANAPAPGGEKPTTSGSQYTKPPAGAPAPGGSKHTEPQAGASVPDGDKPTAGGSKYTEPQANTPATSGPKHPEPQADAPATSGPKHPEPQANTPAPGGEKPTTGGSKYSQPPADTPATGSCNQACKCPPVNECLPGSAASLNRNATEICNKKVKTETECKALSNATEVRDCLCSVGKYADKRFFDEAIICSRRSGECNSGEFQAQVFFEVKYRFCQLQNIAEFSAAYNSVLNEWQEARAPNAQLM